MGGNQKALLPMFKIVPDNFVEPSLRVDAHKDVGN